MNERLYQDPEIGNVTFRKSSRARGLSIRIHPERGVTVTLPRLVPFAAGLAFFQARHDWVVRTVRAQQERLKGMDALLPEGETIESLRSKAKADLPPRLSALARQWGFQYGRVTIKHNLSNWGSCSARGNINLNLNLMRLPVPLRDYVLLHELAHLRHPNHGADFHLLLERLLADHFSRHLDDPEFRTFLPAISATRARYRLTHVLEQAIRKYHLL
ncbi:MAG: M48 family metallopeptidase [Bacteroidales bacterium]|nr:M48 family metallopeptidase [Bacteroidales bacterium]